MQSFRFLIAVGLIALAPAAVPAFAGQAAPAAADYSVGPQYDTTHVYVPAEDFDRFVQSVAATLGGTPNPGGEFQVTPTPSLTRSQLLVTPAGTVSVFGFRTPVPYPFGQERTGYLVTDMDTAVAAARAAGAIRVVETFPDPIGRDTLIQWPGGSVMQLYWHTRTPHYPAPVTVPEDRIYVTADAADSFVKAWQAYSQARLVSDEKTASGADIGQPGKPYRRIRMTSGYGRTTVIVTNGALAWPYGRERTGYEVADLDATLARAQAADVKLLVPPVTTGDRRSAMVEFPGGYIAEIHQPVK
jgi:hypothetical protein